MRTYVRSLLLCAAAVVGLAPAAFAQPSVQQTVRDQITQSGRARVIVGLDVPAVDVRMAPGSTQAMEAEQAAIRRAVDDVLDRVATGITIGHRYQNLPFFSGWVDSDALAALAAMPEVRSIEEDVLDRATLAESVPLIGAPTAWAAGFRGAGWTVAVLDTGMQTNHSFYAGRVPSEACYSNAGGAGGGTSVCPGGGSSSTAPGSGINCGVDGCEHGTHVAGIIGGSSSTRNGVAPDAGLIAMQVFTRFDDTQSCGTNPGPPCVLTFSSDQIAAMDRVLALAGANNVNRIAAINMSLGGGRFSSQATCDANNTSRKAAIDRLVAVGIGVIVASGNNGFTTEMSAPGCISSAVSVGSTTKTDAISTFTNRTPFLSLMAPGSSITSSVTGSTFASLSGTSMATPHVAGAWAVLKQAFPTASVAQILNALRNTGTNVTDATGTYKRINVNAARLALAGGGTGAPGAPGRPTHNPQNGASPITISWTAPTDGGPVAFYTLQAGSASGNYNLGSFNMGLQLSLPATPVPNGTYFIRVLATNASGTSASPEHSFTIGPQPPGRPNAPTVSPASGPGPVTISWAQPPTGGAAASFVLLAGTAEGLSNLGVFPMGGTTSITVSPAPGTYFVRVIAVNALGAQSLPSPDASFTITPPVLAVPGVPTFTRAEAIGNTVHLAWAPGAGGTVDVYDLQAVAQATGAVYNLSFPGSVTSQSFPGIPAGNFIVQIRARNGFGASAFSGQRIIVVGVVLIAGDMQVTLTWNTTGDVDLHAREPNGTHVYYANKNGTTAALDVDNQNAYGPENIYVRQGQAAAGLYQIYVVNFARAPAGATATIQVRLRPGTASEQVRVFTRTLGAANSNLGYNVANIDIANGTIVETTGTRVPDERPGDAVFKTISEK